MVQNWSDYYLCRWHQVVAFVTDPVGMSFKLAECDQTVSKSSSMIATPLYPFGSHWKRSSQPKQSTQKESGRFPKINSTVRMWLEPIASILSVISYPAAVTWSKVEDKKTHDTQYEWITSGPGPRDCTSGWMKDGEHHNCWMRAGEIEVDEQEGEKLEKINFLHLMYYTQKQTVPMLRRCRGSNHGCTGSIDAEIYHNARHQK